MRRSSTAIFLTAALLLSVLALMGAGPNQEERPPQPFFQDFFSGTVVLQGSAAPVGTQLIACIDDCDSVFQSAPYSLKADGTFDQLQIDPPEEKLVGHTIYFFLVNEYGRIRAEESRPYIGVFDFYVQDLTFTEPLPIAALVIIPDPTPTASLVIIPDPTPTASLVIIPDPTPTASLVIIPDPTPTASLPIAGDPSVTLVPRLALGAGAAALVAGGAFLLVARRKTA